MGQRPMTNVSEQQERFCRLIIKGLTQTEAYKQAGYKAANDNVAAVNANRLIRNAKIAKRLQELRKPIAAKFEVTTEFLATELINVWKASIAAEDRTNARQALMDLAKLTGQIVDLSRVQADNVNYNISGDPLPAEQWEQEFADKDAMGSPAGAPARSN